MILVWSMKNPNFPEFIYNTESGVMCIDISPEHPFLVAVGFYDGNVAVFNLKEPKDVPSWVCPIHSKHTEPVWQVNTLESFQEED